MWQTKLFKTREAMASWLARHDGQIQFTEVFVNNGYGITWRKLRWIG